MNVIYFSNIRRENTILKFDVKSTKLKTTNTILFDIAPYKAKKISNEAIACVMATFVGKGYERVCGDFSLDNKTIDGLEKFTNTKWEVKKRRKPLMLFNRIFKLKYKKEKYILNFSGGFDSLAAKAIMPKNIELVSVDFGGWFNRETKFFSTFPTHIVKTNLRELKYDRESWTFMGVGTLLLADILKAKYFAFGTILEASTYNFKTFGLQRHWYTMPFSILGLEETRITQGLTEIGTAIIVSYYYPELVNASIESLASEGSEKKYRKQQLMSIVCKKFNRNLCIKTVQDPKPDQKHSWGTNFATDFLALYEIKYIGIDIVEKTIESIPVEAIDLAKELKLNFYERISKENLDIIPSDIQEHVKSKLFEAGIEEYDANDYREFNIVVEFMRRYYSNL